MAFAEDLAEDGFALVVVLALVYFGGKALLNSSTAKAAADAAKKAATDAFNAGYNSVTGTLSSNQISTIAQQTSQDVMRAGGTPAQGSAAAQEVTNYANWSKPLVSNIFGFGTITADAQVPGTGQTVYELRKLGYSDDDILSFFGSTSAIETNSPGAFYGVVDTIGAWI